jgi:putative membrane protein
MAFGFVIEKFSIFVKGISYFMEKEGMHHPPQAGSTFFGMVLIAIGAVMSLFSYVEYLKIEKQIEEGKGHQPNRMAMSLTILVIVIGALLVYLI